MTALYVLKLEYIEAANRLQDLDIDTQTMIDTLDSMGGDIEEKVTNTMFVCRNTETSSEAIKAAAAMMLTRAKAMDARITYLKKGIFDAMTQTGINKIESPYFTVSIATNPGAVDVFEPGLIPSDYMREIPATEVIDKVLIAKAIKDGFDVPGARIVKSQRLSVK